MGNTVQEMLQAVGNATKIRTLPPGSQSMPYTTARVFDAQGNYHLVLQTMLSALLCALASEHGFMLLRLVTKHLFERMLWQGSKEEAYVRGLNWQLRRDYITSREGEAYEKEINRLIGRRQRDLDDIQTGSNANMQMPSAEFWQEQNVALSKSKDQ